MCVQEQAHQGDKTWNLCFRFISNPVSIELRKDNHGCIYVVIRLEYKQLLAAQHCIGISAPCFSRHAVIATTSEMFDLQTAKLMMQCPLVWPNAAVAANWKQFLPEINLVRDFNSYSHWQRSGRGMGHRWGQACQGTFDSHPRCLCIVSHADWQNSGNLQRNCGHQTHHISLCNNVVLHPGCGHCDTTPCLAFLTNTLFGPLQDLQDDASYSERNQQATTWTIHGCY